MYDTTLLKTSMKQDGKIYSGKSDTRHCFSRFVGVVTLDSSLLIRDIRVNMEVNMEVNTKYTIFWIQSITNSSHIRHCILVTKFVI